MPKIQARRISTGEILKSVELPLEKDEIPPETYRELARSFASSSGFRKALDLYVKDPTPIGRGRNSWRESADYRPLTHSRHDATLHMEESKDPQGGQNLSNREKAERAAEKLRHQFTVTELREMFKDLLGE